MPYVYVIIIPLVVTYSKTAAFTAEQQQLARVAKALAHPARIAIIQFLASKTTCISGDIAAELPLARTTVTQHLQELKAVDLIRGEIEGVTVCYCLNTELLHRVQQQFSAFFIEATSGGPDTTCVC
ncbi:ArsR/SmtB family transcription factor [Hymenobacter baengnokdamensis]|uniref:ArsR/SmtB family transcription factor n=1 Tax=Hymenobacter baengnokdamensis TaxID=2615203 RepID=UPI001E369C30|nr:metalloregulator ArsR/SmtB family transcription factor [Hymenobacter baengnokdamensis]